jgi:uncharacterized protein (DUF885 family)
VKETSIMKTLIPLLIITILITSLLGCSKTEEAQEDRYKDITDIDTLFSQITVDILYNDAALTRMLTPDQITENDRIPAFIEDRDTIKTMEKILDALIQIDVSLLKPEQKLTYDVAKYYVSKKIEGEKYIDQSHVLNPYDAAMTAPMRFLLNHKIENKNQARAYLDKLSMIEKVVKEMVEHLEARKKAGVIPAAQVIDMMLRQLDSLPKTKESWNTYTKFTESLGDFQDIDPKDKEKMIKKAGKHAENIVNTYKDMSHVIEGYKDKLYSKPGLSQWPQGREYYSYLLSKETTTNLTPQEIHNIGLEEVVKIQTQIENLLKHMGYEGLSIHEAIDEISTKGLIADRDVLRLYYNSILQEMEKAIPTMFDFLPTNKVEIGIYNDKDMVRNGYARFSEPQGKGIFVVNNAYPTSRYKMRTTTYHEALPGHHLQFCAQFYASSLMKTMHFNAYQEGWALYAETLAYEQGFLKEKEHVLGYLEGQLIRAARLVIDTGLHYKDWSRQEAIDYMYKVTGKQMEDEVDRYIAWPGQACSYKIGQLEILKLRQRAMEQMGEKFDLKEFHSVIIEKGPMPMEVLGKEVERYIQSKQ